jgi:hypothetical protein
MPSNPQPQPVQINDPWLESDDIEYVRYSNAPPGGESLQIGESVDVFGSYNRYGLMSSADPHMTGFAYLFLTTPSLNVSDDLSWVANSTPFAKSSNNNMKASSYFQELASNEPAILRALSYPVPGSNPDASASPFIKLLSNKFTAIDMRDTVLRTKAVGETPMGYKLTLPMSYIESVSSEQLSITFHETSGLEVTKMIKLWVEYIHMVSIGWIVPNPYCLLNLELDYVSSIFYICTKPDGRTITYYAKFTGAFPIAVPYSAFGYKLGERDLPELTIPFAYNYKEDMDPDILAVDFNCAANGGLISGSAPAIDVSVSQEPADQSESGSQPKLKWVLNFGGN